MDVGDSADRLLQDRMAWADRLLRAFEVVIRAGIVGIYIMVMLTLLDGGLTTAETVDGAVMLAVMVTLSVLTDTLVVRLQSVRGW